MPAPEGYRKSATPEWRWLSVFKKKMPIITFIDHPGAPTPASARKERGQSESDRPQTCVRCRV
ncbi:Acetyl-coenzyme A carboxyl transferase alpha chain [Klebsiella pneumoniae IS39]|nr:Acetyl-coenzyme A carboxyl transferase alpha chain [Klebsiella pneumoniae IS39]